MDATTSIPAGRSRVALGLAGLGVIAAAAAWQWSWLVAIGAARVLLSVAPCVAMCGLGLCIRIGGRAYGTTSKQGRADPEGIEC